MKCVDGSRPWALFGEITRARSAASLFKAPTALWLCLASGQPIVRNLSLLELLARSLKVDEGAMQTTTALSSTEAAVAAIGTVGAVVFALGFQWWRTKQRRPKPGFGVR
jgi:hypothetical protein